MSIFIENGESCERMSFEEFQAKVMNVVRHKNYMDMVDSWEKHVIFKDFHKGQHNDYYATVYYADKDFENKDFHVTIYNFTYNDINNKCSFDCVDGTLNKDEIQAISRLSNCFARNKDRFFDCMLEDYQKRYMTINTNEKVL